ncbi:lasso peptide biosynthesis B2 protein [Streptomyces huasconensis]|uniref:lasso peptide biosynthesis B2 protein n=1 Tax=Streptomyces huasconensis TaxID=1854574 RepID=UPI0033FE85C3
MSSPVSLPERRRIPVHRRIVPLAAVGVARLMARMSPARLRVTLEFIRRNVPPATAEQALSARHAVTTVSLRCAGQGCLQRSIAVALLCRARGAWPTWCTGVRTNPFAAHAWVEVDNEPIGENLPAGHFQRLLIVPPFTASDND